MKLSSKRMLTYYYGYGSQHYLNSWEDLVFLRPVSASRHSTKMPLLLSNYENEKIQQMDVYN